MIPDEEDPAEEPAGLDAVDIGAAGQSLVFILRRAQTAVAQEFARLLAAEELRPSQFAALSALKHNPGLRQGQLSHALGIKRTNFVPLFDVLERRGLAERRAVARDRRAVALFLTRTGAETLERLEAVAGRYEARLTARLGGENARATLNGLLYRLVQRELDPG